MELWPLEHFRAYLNVRGLKCPNPLGMSIVITAGRADAWPDALG